MSESPRDLLRRTFGFDQFRGAQEGIIDALIGGRDCLVLMPTGGGKSLCYQIPAMLRDGTGIVVSPLIALMQDQVEALAQLGVRAAFLNSSLSGADAAAVEQALLAGELDLLYVAPERLLTARFLGLLERCRIALFAIDEAHCVSQWGHDFRPEYRALDCLHTRWPKVPRIALTATADERTRGEIVEHLALHEAEPFVASFDRPNIRYRVAQKDDARNQLLRFLEDHRGEAGIVYCLSRRKVEETATFLSQRGIVALPYHAGLPAEQRATHQRRFLREEGLVMTATIAFGMGIDKPDVRFVAHLDLPKSIEGYYQETGRAGRDGAPADAWLCYGLGDAVTLSQMIASGEADDQRKRLEHAKLDALLAYCEDTRCRRAALLACFGESYPAPCGNCDNCLEPPATWDATEAARKALSCVYRTGQRFGAGHLIDVLRGADTERMQRFGHDQVSTFGIGNDLDQRQWRSVFRQLVAAGLLGVDPDGHGGLRLTAASGEILRGERQLTLRRDLSVRPTRRSRSRTATPASVVSAHATPAFERLRALRAQLAREQNVPPYVIFHDATLKQIAQMRPRDLDELAHVDGVGVRKLERYGNAVLDALAEVDAA